MTSFKKFSDAASFYAKNADLVDLMYEQMKSEIADFFAALETAVQEQVGREVLTKTTRGYWYCWLSRPGVTDAACFQVWGRLDDPKIVLGRLELGVGAPEADRDTLARLALAATEPEVRDFCVAGSGKAWSLMTATITCAHEDAVGRAADQLSKLFLAADALLEKSS